MATCKLVKSTDDGGERYYLNGRPVHCGDALELRLPGDHWARVRYEMSFSRSGGFEPVLHLYVARELEQRFEVRSNESMRNGLNQGSGCWEVHDLERDAPVRLSDRYEDGFARWDELEADSFGCQFEAKRVARELNGIYNRPLEVVIREWDGCVLRWTNA